MTQPLRTPQSLALSRASGERRGGRWMRDFARASRYGHRVQRLCARTGCRAIATATFTFDARECTVWLDVPHAAGARAGELCERHALALIPPLGWRLDDRRIMS
jgi:uncharacterized protein DUF3499